MVNINDKDESIEVTEYLTFNGTVQNVYDDFLDCAKDYENEFTGEEEEKLKKFINYKLTHEDKIEILENIVDEYERSSNYFNNCSIFDDDIIRTAINDWITDTFEIELLGGY